MLKMQAEGAREQTTSLISGGHALPSKCIIVRTVPQVCSQMLQVCAFIKLVQWCWWCIPMIALLVCIYPRYFGFIWILTALWHKQIYIVVHFRTKTCNSTSAHSIHWALWVNISHINDGQKVKNTPQNNSCMGHIQVSFSCSCCRSCSFSIK